MARGKYYYTTPGILVQVAAAAACDHVLCSMT